MGMSCSYVMSCVFVTIVRTGQILSKIKNVKNYVYRFVHLQSACDIGSDVLRDLDLPLQGHIFQILESRKWWELAQNWRDLDLLLQGQIFQISITRKRWKLAKNAQVWSLYRLIFAIELDHFEYCTPWPFPKFSRSNFPIGYFDR